MTRPIKAYAVLKKPLLKLSANEIYKDIPMLCKDEVLVEVEIKLYERNTTKIPKRTRRVA
ncbi:MAG: hypothetical protein ACR2IQ_02755 [Minisyncoccia bacterium]